MKRKLRVYVAYLNPVNAITYYRNLQLLKVLEEQEKVVILHDDFHPVINQDRRSLMLQNSDIGFSHCVPTVQAFRDYGRMLDIPPTYAPADRSVKYPPQWVTDIDDVYDWVSPTNPSFATWGVRDLQGEVIEQGGRVIATLQTGEEKTIFEDGEPIPGDPYGMVFSIKANYERLAKLKTAINQSACVTATTETLKQHIMNEDKPRRVEVIPNCMWEKDFPEVELKGHKGIRVLWQGGSSHYDDWLSLRAGINKAAEKYPDVTWVFYGQNYEFLFADVKNKERYGWVDFAAHRLMLSTLDYDINIVPLADNKFNVGKSALKFYEASALHKPVPTLAANVGPYKEIEDGRTGLLFDGPEDFVTKLGGLIEDSQLRRELADNAKTWVLENRNAEKWAPKLLELFLEIREEQIKRVGDLRELLGASEEVYMHTAPGEEGRKGSFAPSGGDSREAIRMASSHA